MNTPLGDNNHTFCVDTSAFLDAWERYYSPDVFSSLWNQLDELVQKRTIIISTEVYNEMKKKSDGVVQWARSHRSYCVTPNDEIFLGVRTIMKQFPNFVNHHKDRSGADPFVIATAQLEKGTVVTAEKPGKKNDPKIPDVCSYFGVPCLSLLQMFRELHIAF